MFMKVFKRKLFVYPQIRENQLLNPYVDNMEKALGSKFELVHPEYPVHLPQSFRLLLSAFRADVYVFNWVESASLVRGNSFFQARIKLLALHILFLRKAKIVWIFHNIHPHEGETKWSKRIKSFLFHHATIIISHSREAAEYAKKQTQAQVCFKNHPVGLSKYGKWGGKLKECDFFIWGNILPYKGISELVNNPLCSLSGRKILIVGKCADEELSNTIKSCCDENVVFENRCASFEEVAAQCRKAKYVLFPYVGESVSSSGALIDTLQMGGTPVGPNRGAFADLANDQCCIVYDNINEIFNLPISDSYKRVSLEAVEKFLKENSWNSFAEWLYDCIIQLG